MVIAMRIKLQGFIVFDYVKEYPAARKELAQWLEEGKLQRKETILKGGLKAAEQGLVDLYNGINTGMSQHESSRMRADFGRETFG